MAKKGWKATHRVRFEWSNGVKGVIACYTKDDAEMKAQELRDTAEQRDDITLTVSIEPITRNA